MFNRQKTIHQHLNRRDEILKALGLRKPDHRPEKDELNSPLKSTEGREMRWDIKLRCIVGAVVAGIVVILSINF